MSLTKINKLLVLFVVVPLLSGCANDKDHKDLVTITDMQDRVVTYNSTKTDRVICLGAGALRYYSYIGDIENIVAVEEIDKQPFGVGTALRPYFHVNKDFFKDLPTCGKGGPMAQVPEYEAILKVNPNIIVSFYDDPAVNNTLQETVGVPVIALKQGQFDIFNETTLKSLELLGKVFSREWRYLEIKSYIDTCNAQLSSLEETSETYYAGCIGNWGKTNLFGSFNDFPVFTHAKVKNALSPLPDLAHYRQVTIDKEKLVELDPDKIFLDGSGVSGFITDYKQDSSVYDTLKAFENNEVYMLLPFNAYYTNLEIQLMSTFYVASIAHPSSFNNFDIEAKSNEIMEVFFPDATYVSSNLYKEFLEYSTSYGGYQKVDIAELTK